MVCQSVARPSTAEYWHIGDTTMRLASVSLRSEYGEKSDGDTVRTNSASVRGRPRRHRGRCRGFTHYLRAHILQQSLEFRRVQDDRPSGGAQPIDGFRRQHERRGLLIQIVEFRLVLE